MAFKIEVLGPSDAKRKAQAGFKDWEKRKDAGERKAALEAKEAPDAKPAEGMSDAKAKLSPEEKRKMDSDLIKAVRAADKARVLELLESGADVDAKDDSGNTTMMYAILRGGAEIVKILVDNGVCMDDDVCSGNRITALMGAAKWGMTEIAMVLIGMGADVNFIGHRGMTALMQAASNGQTETAEMLIANGAEINARDSHSNTARGLASRKGHRKTEKMLAGHGGKY